MLKLCVYVPASHLQGLKQAMFDAGAGRQGDYEHCCWQTLGRGQFRPMPGSRPFIGEQGGLSTVLEYRVEMLCEEACIEPVVAALKAAHPYEEPAYDVMPCLDC